jgi:ribA/ribD-fused uncharacterized protein
MAKSLGRKVTLRENWDEIKAGTMEELVRQKFLRHPDLAQVLLATGEKTLIEGNHWNDRFWGVCRGYGQNHLGNILMKVRAEIRR